MTESIAVKREERRESENGASHNNRSRAMCRQTKAAAHGGAVQIKSTLSRTMDPWLNLNSSTSHTDERSAISGSIKQVSQNFETHAVVQASQ